MDEGEVTRIKYRYAEIEFEELGEQGRVGSKIYVYIYKNKVGERERREPERV